MRWKSNRIPLWVKVSPERVSSVSVHYHNVTTNAATAWNCVRRRVRGCPVFTTVRRPAAVGGRAVGVQRCTAPPPRRARPTLFILGPAGGATRDSRPRDAQRNARVRQVTQRGRIERCIRNRTTCLLQTYTHGTRIIRERGTHGWRWYVRRARGGRRVSGNAFPCARRRRCGTGGGCMRWWTSYWFLSARASLNVAVQGEQSIVAPTYTAATDLHLFLHWTLSLDDIACSAHMCIISANEQFIFHTTR